MKKLTAMILALVLSLTIGCAALAEEAGASEITISNWLLKSLTDTDWIQKEGRASLDIQPVGDPEDEEQFRVIVEWANSAEEVTEWNFYGKYDWETGVLLLDSEYCYDVIYNEDGGLELSTERYSRDCNATLTLDEDGLLILNGSEEEQLSPIGFEPLPAATEKTAPVTEAQAAIFAKATEGLLGVDYEPVCLIEEMDEIYYVFLCKGTVVYPGAEPAYYLAVIVDYGTEAPTAEFIQLMDDGSQG